MSKNPSRFEVYNTLLRIPDIGYYYLLSKATDMGFAQVILNFNQDIKFKLGVTGNYFIEQGVEKGKGINIVKTKLLQECINCDDLDKRNSITFQKEIADKIIQEYLQK